jgi:hypothetical protein
LIECELDGEEWAMLDSLEKVLYALFKATEMLGGKKYSTVGIAFFALINLREYLEEQTNNVQINTLKSLLLSQLKHYFEDDTDQYQLLKVILFAS